MKNLIFTIIATASIAALADTQVYRLTLDTDSGAVNLVGQDGVSRRVVLVDPEEYTVLTGRFDKVWASMNATDAGRTSLHGKRVSTVVDATNRVKTVVYRDGYRFTAPFVERATRPQAAKVVVERRPSSVSARQWAMRKKIEAIKNGAAKTVTVTHDAATGEDVVK